MTISTTRFAAVIAVALCWLAASLSASAIEIQEVTSPKGIKAWLVEEHALPLIAMNFSFGAGGATVHDRLWVKSSAALPRKSSAVILAMPSGEPWSLRA